jgi:hypothetical protein
VVVSAARPRAPDLDVRERALTGALSELIREGRVQMIGAIRRSCSRAFARKKSLSRCGIIWGLLMSRELRLLTMRKQRTYIICAGLVESRARRLIS